MSVRPDLRAPLAAAALAAALATALGGCGGPDAPAGAEPVYQVVARPEVTTRAGRPGAALSRVWEFEGEARGWDVPAGPAAPDNPDDPDNPADPADPAEPALPAPAAGADPSAGAGPTRATIADGVLRLSGRERLLLTGPFGTGDAAPPIDPEIHHWLSLRLATTTARTLTIAWRAEGQAFDPGRTTSPIALHPDGQWHVHALALSEMRGSAHAEDGVAAFLLRFEGPDDVEVAVDQVALLSDHDAPAAGPRALQRQGVLRRGALLPLPGEAAFELDARAGDRVSLAVALAGAAAPLELDVEDGAGRSLHAPLTLRPGEGWRDLDLSLEAPAAGGPVSVVLRGGDGAGTHAALMIGSVLHLRPMGRPAREPAPDVLLYVIDTLRADRLASYGHDRPTDPTLAAIAAEGAAFEQVLAASNWTRPSMSSLLTSLPPPAHGNQVHGTRVPEAAVTLAEAFAAAGWRTAACITNFHAGDWAGLAQGFDVHFGPRWRGAYRVGSTLTSDLVAEWLDAELAGSPRTATFMLVLSLDPHAPYEPPAAALAALTAGARARDSVTETPPSWSYDAEVRHNDGNLARLDATLARLGRRGSTLLAVTADHGEAFGEHGQWQHRKSLHQEEVRVPWIVRWPGQVAAGARLAAPVSHVDVAPTLLGLAGVPAPADWEGRDLSAWLRGQGGPPPPDRPLFSDAVYLAEDDPAHPHELAVVVAPYKLITRVHPRANGGVEVRPHALYDLVADPGETQDLLGDPARAAVVDGLLAQARDLLARGRVLPEQGSLAADMDPLMRRWMAEMGYLK